MERRGDFHYDGTPKLVTAEAIGAVNGDALTVIIEDGSHRNRRITARAAALAGGKAGNYVLPETQTFSFQIKKALETAAVTPSTVTAVIAGSDDSTDWLLRPSRSRFLRRMPWPRAIR